MAQSRAKRGAAAGAARSGGGMNAGTVYATLKLYDGEFLTPLARANTGLQQFTQGFFYVETAAQKAGQTLGAFGLAGAAATVGLAKLSMDLEQTQIAFRTLIGSAEGAQAMLQELRDFAVRTPFEFVGLQDSTKRLLAFGFAARDIVPLLTDIGDATAAMGGNKELLDRIILALGQMQAKAKVTGNEMRQLTEAGIPGWRYLAEAMGKSTAEVMKMSEQGLLPAAEGIKALREGIQRDFGGMMAEQAKTAAGQLSNLIDQVKITGAEFGTTLLPAFKSAIGQVNALVTGINQLSPELKTAIAYTVAYGSALALLGSGLLFVGNQILQVIAWTWGYKAAQAAANAEAVNATASVLAYGASLQAVAAAEIEAATAAIAAADAMAAEAAATGTATEADLAFIAAERGKAAAALQTATAMQTEGAAMVASANATRVSFLGLSPVMWGVVGAIAALVAGWKALEYAQDAQPRSIRSLADASDDLVRKGNDQIVQLNTLKTKRQAEAQELKNLQKEYEGYGKKTNLTATEHARLTSIKETLHRRMKEIRTELGLQSGAWDGTTASIKSTINALLDFTEIERKAFMTSAQVKLDEARRDWLNTKADRVDKEKGAGSALPGPQGSVISTLRRLKLLPSMERQLTDTDMIPLNDVDKKELQYLNELKNREAASYQNYLKQKALVESLQGLTPEELDRLRKQGTGISIPTGMPSDEKNAKGRSPEEVYRAYVAVAEDLLKAEKATEAMLLAQGKLVDAAAAHERVLRAQNDLQYRLTRGTEKWAADTKVGADARQKLADLERDIADDAEKRAAREREIVTLRTEQTRQLTDDLAVAERAVDAAKQRYGPNSPEYLQATGARNRAFAAVQQQGLDDIGLLFANGSLRDFPGAIGAVRTIRDTWREATSNAFELLDINQQSDAVLQVMAEKVMSDYQVKALTLAQAREQLTLLQSSSSTEERRRAIGESLVRLSEDEQQAADDAASAREKAAKASEEELERLQASADAARALTDEYSRLSLELEKVRAKGDADAEVAYAERLVQKATAAQVTASAIAATNPADQAAQNRLLEAGLALAQARQQLADAVAAWQKANWKPLEGEVPGITFQTVTSPEMDPETPGAPSMVIRDFRQIAAEFGRSMWDFSRDKGRITSYLDAFSAEWQKRAISNLLYDLPAMQVNTATGLPNFVHNIFPKLNQRAGESDDAYKARMSDFKGKVGGALGAAGSIYSLATINTTDTMSAMLQGASGGLGLAAGLSQLGLIGGGPLTAGIGALVGVAVGLMQASSARSQAEEMQRKIEEEQLRELRKISNVLQPVADFFQRGGYGALAPATAYAGGAEASWAVLSRRGMLV